MKGVFRLARIAFVALLLLGGAKACLLWADEPLVLPPLKVSLPPQAAESGTLPPPPQANVGEALPEPPPVGGAESLPAPPPVHGPQVLPTPVAPTPQAAPTATGTAPPDPNVAVPPPPLSLEAAVTQALQNNPGILAFRQQRGIAAAGVVIARTYPFNPAAEGKVMGVTGPASAGVTNHVLVDQKFLFTLEVCGQGTYRRQAADAHLSRVEWDVATQEALLAIKTTRAFQTVLYRWRKLALAVESVKLGEKAAQLIEKLREQGKLSPVDLIQIRTEIIENRAQLGPFQAALTLARDDLGRELGRLDCDYAIQGDLEYPEVPLDCAALSAAALDLRPDLRSFQAAVVEAQSVYSLERANRWGNPVLGPAFEINETNASFIGIQYAVPIALFNRKQGEIQQRQTEVAKAGLDLKQAEFLTQLEVRAALRRLQRAQAWVQDYEGKVFPAFRKGLKEIEQLFEQAEPNVDYLRVLDFQRRWLKAQDGHLDALYELSQARADLAAAVGDLHLLFPAATPPAPPR